MATTKHFILTTGDGTRKEFSSAAEAGEAVAKALSKATEGDVLRVEPVKTDKALGGPNAAGVTADAVSEQDEVQPKGSRQDATIPEGSTQEGAIPFRRK